MCINFATLMGMLVKSKNYICYKLYFVFYFKTLILIRS